MFSVDYIALELKRRGLTLWTFPGGTIFPLYDACRRAGVPVVVARSETGAGYAAIGAAKATGQPQVVAVTSGPGATNLVSAICDAYYDGVPLVALTGQVGTAALHDTELTKKRQGGFQQTPTGEIMRPIAVNVFQPREPRKLALNFDLALHECCNGDRAGPVVIDMPMDVQRSETDYDPVRVPAIDPVRPTQKEMAQVVSLLHQAKRPVVIAGAGCLKAAELLRELVERCHVRVTASLPAVGIVPTNDLHWLGMLGHTGHAAANLAVHEADLIVALGTRLDVRQTGTEVQRFAPGAKIVRVEASYLELAGARVRQDVALQADCGEFLKALLKRVDLPVYDFTPVVNLPDAKDDMARLMLAISKGAPDDCIFTTGVGSHQQHAARWLFLDQPKRMFLTSAGHGCMGAGLPMAIGAALATGRKALVIDGDGSFQMTMNELGTIVRYGLEEQIEIHVVDNGAGGIVSQFARLQGWDPRETNWKTGNPRFEFIAGAYGLGLSVHHVRQDGVWPILEAGRTMDSMTEGQGDRVKRGQEDKRTR